MTDSLDGDPKLGALQDHVIAELRAGRSVDVDSLADGNEDYVEALSVIVSNWEDIHADACPSSEQAQKEKAQKEKARQFMKKHPEFDGYRLKGILGVGGCSMVFSASSMDV